MMSNMMGDDSYGSEDDGATGSKRIPEEEFDFM